jgi:hypothetical protein
MDTLLRDGTKEPREEGAADYFVVVGENWTWYVSTEMARFIEESLESGAEWVKFVDLSGSRIRLRAEKIEFIAQSTADQRATERDFFRAMRRENKADRDWDA